MLFFLFKDDDSIVKWKYCSFDTKWEPGGPFRLLATIPSKGMHSNWAPIKELAQKSRGEIEGLHSLIAYKVLRKRS